MKLPENIVPLPAEQRAELKRLAEAATPGPWRSCWEDEPKAEDGLNDIVIETVAPPAEPYGKVVFGYLWYDGPHAGCTKENAAYIAAVSPDVALATLAYVEALEGRLATLEDEAAAARIELVQELLTEWRDSTAPADVTAPAAHQAWDGWQREHEQKKLNHRAFFDIKCVQLTGRRLEPGGIYAGIPAKSPTPAPLAGEAGPALAPRYIQCADLLPEYYKTVLIQPNFDWAAPELGRRQKDEHGDYWQVNGHRSTRYAIENWKGWFPLPSSPTENAARAPQEREDATEPQKGGQGE